MNAIRRMLRHGEWANGEILRCARGLSDDSLDRKFEMGPGSLRRTLLHIHNGESVWLERWKGISPEWPSEEERIGVRELEERFAALYADRAAFLDGLAPHAFDQMQVYQDSKGGTYQATLGDMLIQGCTHSTHHRAQAVNMLRRLRAETPEIDYMYWTRHPVSPPVEAVK
jgi:uncharacterized damage-inducible protein DinB